jgi:hypothetical protein
MVMEMAGRMSISIAAAVEIWDVVVIVKGSNKVIALVQRQRSIILSRRLYVDVDERQYRR